MIKLVHAKWVEGSTLSLAFSDGSQGIYDFHALLAKNTALTLPLRDAVAFQRFFLELGALCWPNGLEFSASKLHSELAAAGALLNAEHAA
jgi:Protein of unknown function (DUF2442)